VAAGKAGATKAARARPQVLDVQMPGMGGLKLQSHLAASDRQILIVFVTSYPDAGVRDKLLWRRASHRRRTTHTTSRKLTGLLKEAAASSS